VALPLDQALAAVSLLAQAASETRLIVTPTAPKAYRVIVFVDIAARFRQPDRTVRRTLFLLEDTDTIGGGFKFVGSRQRLERGSRETTSRTG
jgi:hypothetical protein